MMEFNFEDDLFEEKKSNVHVESEKIFYRPKQCTDEWFLSADTVELLSPEDIQKITFAANLLYYKGDYEAALRKYEERVKVLSNLRNAPMLREINESIIRCYLKLKQYDLAESRLQMLLHGYNNPADSSMYKLAYDIYIVSGKPCEAAVQLVKAIDINPYYPAYWLALFDALKILHANQESFGFDDVKCSLNSNLLCHILVQAKILLTDSLKGRKSCDANIKNKTMLNEIERNLDKFTSVSQEQKLLFVKTCRNGHVNGTDLNHDNNERKSISFFKRWFYIMDEYTNN